ncbi:MAG: lipocalin family protein [Patescibacteria group bacterium]|jgi:predicted secreted hydrolase
MLGYKPIKFPQDELPHDNIIEWWYFNGQLQDRSGRRYPFMDCLFKANPRRVKIPFLPRLPFGDLYFSHHLLTDLAKDKFYSAIEPLVFLTPDSFKKKKFYARYGQPNIAGKKQGLMEKTSSNSWHLKTDLFDLTLTSRKPPLLVGGKGYLTLADTATYYYSLTDLETRGKIFLDGRSIEVRGQSWMDHQWADAAYAKPRWNWFSLQLDNRHELLCFNFNYRRQAFNLASIVLPDGSCKHYRKIEITPLASAWRSPDTGAAYPLTWQIKIPSEKINLQTTPLMNRSEMIFGSINYWEGGLSVAGDWRGKKISGQGFMELVGYPGRLSRINYYQHKIKRQLQGEIKKLFKR